MDRSYKGFKNFVKRIAQRTPDREIDHKGDWCHCSVGEYMKPAGWKSNETLSVWVANNFPDHVFIRLNNGQDGRRKIGTYGKLNNFLQRQG